MAQGFVVGPETVRMLELGHPWILADRYTRQWPSARPGDVAEVCDGNGRAVASVLLDPKDRVVARVLKGRPKQLDRAWIRDRVTEAVALRNAHADLEGTSAYRLVNGEGDALPGLTADRYGDHLMIQLYSSGWQRHLPLVVSVLKEILAPIGIYEKFRPQNTRNLAGEGDTKRYSRLLWGQGVSEKITVQENDLNFWVDLEEGLNTGLFLDQRENRKDLMLRVRGKRVLNLFAYTGAFSVAAAVAGCEKVTSVDASAPYLEWARANFEANRLSPRRHEFITGDCFDVLKRLAAESRRFDVVLMDPPSFSTTAKSRFTTRGGTGELVADALALLSAGGLLITSSNHQKIDLADYLKELRRGVLQTDCELRVVRVAGQPADFPFPVTFPEGRYLKYVMGVKS